MYTAVGRASSKTSAWVRSMHCVPQIQWCAEIDTFLPKVSACGWSDICEILNWLIYMQIGKGASCFYKIGKFVTIITNASTPHHLQSSPKCISHYTQQYYKSPIISISGITQYPFLPDFPVKISNVTFSLPPLYINNTNAFQKQTQN